ADWRAGMVGACGGAQFCPPLPWRVSSSGPVFRYESDPAGGRLREFTQVGVEMLGKPGPAADAEVIGLADRTVRSAGIPDATIRIGRAGLILEVLGHTGLPAAASSALIEMLSAAAAGGKGIQALDSVLARRADALKSVALAEAIVPAVSQADDHGVDRLFRHLVPDVTGRRSGHEIIHRLRRKWDLDHSLSEILGRVRGQFHTLGELRAPAPTVLDRLERTCAGLPPRSATRLPELLHRLSH